MDVTPLQIDVVTLFPDMFQGFAGTSMIRRAVRMGAVNIRMVDLRDFSQDARKTADDRPYGGGPGMLMKPGYTAVTGHGNPQAPGIYPGALSGNV